MINGYGVYKFNNGKFYKGNWKENKMHGQGEMEWPDGKIYKGEFYED